jgi:hypothetical protein
LNFSSIQKKKLELTKDIEKLGGKIATKLKFTHLLTLKPNRGLKYLAAVASGVFVLHPDYIAKCTEKKKFLREDRYEFGNPAFLDELKEKNGIESTDKLFKAAYNWRKWIKRDKLERFRNGAFTGMKFIVATSAPEKVGQFGDVITSGGGEIVDLDFKTSFKSAAIQKHKIDVCLVEQPKILSKINNEVLKNCNVKVLQISSLNSYLISEEAPETFI